MTRGKRSKMRLIGAGTEKKSRARDTVLTLSGAWPGSSRYSGVIGLMDGWRGLRNGLKRHGGRARGQFDKAGELATGPARRPEVDVGLFVFDEQRNRSVLAQLFT